jgi:hypothetical protein
MKRYDNHLAVDDLMGVEERTLVRFNPYETKTRQLGQEYVINVVPIEEWYEGISSFDVAFREPDGFVKSIIEIVPEDYHVVLRPSFLEIEWTFDLAEALLFDSESIRILAYKARGLKSVDLRLPYSSSRPSDWLGSIEQFPAQKALDKMLDRTEVMPLFR